MSTRTRGIARELERRLPSSYTIVAYPDHLHLFRGPDIVVGGNGRMIGVFILSQGNAVTGALRARLIATRLAFPSHLATVAVHTLPDATATAPDFDYNLLDRKAAAEIATLADAAGTRSRDDIPPEVKFAAYTRYEVLRLYAQQRRLQRQEGAAPIPRFSTRTGVV